MGIKQTKKLFNENEEDLKTIAREKYFIKKTYPLLQASKQRLRIAKRALIQSLILDSDLSDKDLLGDELFYCSAPQQT